MSVIRPGSIVFDIGAHHGESALNFLRAGAGLVVSVEPCLENYLILHEATLESKVIPIHAAAWGVPCIAGARLAVNQTGLSSLNPDKWKEAYPEASFGPPQDIPAITLDMLIGRYGLPSYIKIDVEGTEGEVIRGLSQKVPFLTFEFHGKFLTDTLSNLQRLEELGFTKAIHNLEDVDLNLIPEMEISAFGRWFEELNPKWGNITAS